MKTLFLSALMLGFAAVSFAETPKGESKATEAATVTETKAAGAVKWFEFTGSPGQESNASLYNEIATPDCDENPLLPYRCEIQIQSQGTSPDRPDLSQTVVAETKKND